MATQGVKNFCFLNATMRCLVVLLLLLRPAHSEVELTARPAVVREVVRSEDYAQVDPGLWPRKVLVRQGDPITGNAQVLEIWNYNVEFARRFEGFDSCTCSGLTNKVTAKPATTTAKATAATTATRLWLATS